MIDFNRGNYETADGRSDCQTANSLPFSRRSFLAKTSYFGALYAAAKLLPMAAELAGDTRVSQAPLVDKGFTQQSPIPRRDFRRFATGDFWLAKTGRY